VATAPNQVMVFANPNAYPRTFLAENGRADNQPNAAMDALLDSSTDLRDRSVYEGAGAARPLISTENQSTRSATITSMKPSAW